MSAEELKLRMEQSQMAFDSSAQNPKQISTRLVAFLVAVIALLLCFSVSIYNLLRLAAGDDLYSDLPLIPIISLYLIWMRRKSLPRSFQTDIMPALGLITAGILAIVEYRIGPQEYFATRENGVAIQILALLLLLAGFCFLFFGKRFVRAVAFPLALLVFTIPIPTASRDGLENVLQHGSAVCAGVFFQLFDTPVLRDGLFFHLTNCTLQVAPECSGIHSSLVLLITSLLGGWLFLRSPWKRLLLVLAVIPLAFIRNGFRIFVIGRLCADYGPQMLNSPIHRHGGPLFFALSLIPFFLLLLFLRKTEQTKPPTKELL